MKIEMILITVLLASLLFCGTSYAEDIVLTTYYPAPYGEYDEVRTKKLAIGATYADPTLYGWPGSGAPNTIPDNADLVVEGMIGIGQTSPQEKLEVRGNPAGATPQARNIIRVTNETAAHVYVAHSIIGHDATGPFVQVSNNANRWSVRNAGGGQVITVEPGTGDVGIGTTDPQYDLDVTGTFRVYQAGGNPQILVQVGAANYLRLYSRNDNGNFYIDRSATGISTGTEILTIEPSGNVGIGTTNPDHRLHVAGGTTKTEGGLIIQQSVATPGNELGRMWINPNIVPQS